MQTNIFRALRELLPQPALQVATATATHPDGTTTVQYPGGASQRLRGTATEGQNVFVQAGAIQGPAPSLPLINIDV